jgi:hypothetical protein
MKRKWTYLRRDLASDDLFVRLLFLFIGAVSVGFGGWMAFWALVSMEEPLWARIPLGSLGAISAAWGVLLVLRCFVSAQSRIAAIAERFAPDTPDLDVAVFGLLIFVLPIALLTLGLHASGLRGQAGADHPRVKRTKTRTERRA